MNSEKLVDICAKHFQAVLSNDRQDDLTAFHNPRSDHVSVVGPKSPPSAKEIWDAPISWINTAQYDFHAHKALPKAAQMMRMQEEQMPRPVEIWLMRTVLAQLKIWHGLSFLDFSAVLVLA